MLWGISISRHLPTWVEKHRLLKATLVLFLVQRWSEWRWGAWQDFLFWWSVVLFVDMSAVKIPACGPVKIHTNWLRSSKSIGPAWQCSTRSWSCHPRRNPPNVQKFETTNRPLHSRNECLFPGVVVTLILLWVCILWIKRQSLFFRSYCVLLAYLDYRIAIIILIWNYRDAVIFRTQCLSY